MNVNEKRINESKLGVVANSSAERTGKNLALWTSVFCLLVLVVLVWYVAYKKTSRSVDSDLIKAIDKLTWRWRRTSGMNSARKTGLFMLSNGGYADFCGEPDGTTGLEAAYGEFTGRKFMRTHIAAVNSGGTITAFVDAIGSVREYTPKAVTIVGHPRGQLFSATIRDVENNDCVLLIGVEKDQVVDVRVAR